MNTDPGFWRHKAAEFDRLQELPRPLSADYDAGGYIPQSPLPADRVTRDECWLISGGTPAVIAEFKSCAALAAVALGCGDQGAAWAHWLEYLRMHSEDFVPEEWNTVSASTRPRRPYEPPRMTSADDAADIDFTPRHETGHIPSLCEASARFCRRLANEHEKAAILEAEATARPTAFGRNVEHYKKECGWNYDDLAHYVGLDRSTIADHITQGSTPRSRTLKKYADAFAKQLHRPISPADLIGDVVKIDAK